jgi:cytidine deaminase
MAVLRRPAPDMIAMARAMLDHAYAPYSNFPVAAVLRGADGQFYAGCNVENAAYPQGWCAETSAIAAMIGAGNRSILEILVMGKGPHLVTPCGGCRQRLREFAADTVAVHVCSPRAWRKSFTLGQLLPASFGPRNLAKSRMGR